MNKVASRYAKALLQLAVEQGILERVHTDLLGFDRVCADNKGLAATLKNPTIQHDKKLTILKVIFQDNVHSLTLNFLAMITQKCRASLLPAIVRAFLTQYNQHQGIQIAHVTTTFPLTSRLILQLQEIARRISPCRHIVLDQYIDSTLIGGYVLQVGDKRVDQSLRRNLLTLQKNCVTEGY
ncbi:MAG: ATP synthase F1 subunit delta [Amoebophilaceae bacterium]|jgi:F-type H+-transporting ATPase subunit delta|nr:ATP synthase F1 subunit delta [Amoebophilaceae bacterium]